MELRKLFAYRVDFWFQFLGSTIINFIIAYFLWQAIFEAQGITSLKGMSFSYMIFYSLITPLISRLIGNEGFGDIASDIYHGSLNKYLLYPLSFLNYAYFAKSIKMLFGYLQVFIILVLYLFFFSIPKEINFSAFNFILFVFNIFLAFNFFFLIGACIEMLAFWADNVWSLMVMLRVTVGLLGGLFFPLTLFPEKIVVILKFLPFPYLVFYPFKILVGQLSPLIWAKGMGILLVWTIFQLLFTKFIWAKGNHQYTGVGI